MGRIPLSCPKRDGGLGGGTCRELQPFQNLSEQVWKPGGRSHLLDWVRAVYWVRAATTNCPRAGGLNKLVSTAQEAGNPKIKVPADSVPLQVLSSHGRDSKGSSFKGSNPILRAPPLGPNYQPRPSCQLKSQQGLGLQHMNLRWGTTCKHSAPSSDGPLSSLFHTNPPTMYPTLLLWGRAHGT